MKKPLNQRVHVFGSGTIEPVQRDLYSAFLARCREQDLLDIGQVHAAWPSAELLLLRAMARMKNLQVAGFCSAPRSRERRSGSLVRGRGCVATARAAESVNTGRLRTPGLYGWGGSDEILGFFTMS